jgi:adenine-specific DNA-methyltransferase
MYRYIGNKTRSVGRLTNLVEQRVGPRATVADLMCGTASVAGALRSRGHRVVAADLMTFAVYHAHVRLRIPQAPSFQRLGDLAYQDVLNHLNALPPRRGHVWREYSPDGRPAARCAPRKYFTPENAGRIDAILRQLREWEDASLITADERILLRHDLVLAVNRVANIAGTYGHFRSTWTRGALGTLLLRASDLDPDAPTDHDVHHGRAEDVAALVSADICYLDPPYTKRQYAANYHLPETLARGDEPEAVGVSGLRPWRDQYSDFCSKVRVRDAFSTIFEKIQCNMFLISYSEDGLLGKRDMMRFLSSYGSVQCAEFKFPRFRSNQSPLNGTLTEFVFALERS